MHTIYRYRWVAAFVGAAFCFPLLALSEEQEQNVPFEAASSSIATYSLESEQLINHVTGGSRILAPNFVPGGVPPGIGIPHALINSLPEGDYYAVVFFDGLHGCPSGNYVVNSFRPGVDWDYDVRPLYLFAPKAESTAAGGCMQPFHVDPNKESDWMWGALSNTGTSTAIADAGGVPAFAICATATACNPLAPDVSIESPATTTRALSNILFLPGMKGSLLYEDNPLCLIPSDSCGIPLWLPLSDLTVPELFLDAEGKSKRYVFTKEGKVLASAYGHEFYDSFLQMLDHAKDDGSFGSTWDWKAVTYDWRLSLPDLIQNGAQRGNHVYYEESARTPYIEQELKRLASTSPTGKVTIIAHSNGGLVAKALMKSLGDTLAVQLIDTVIFAGVPQSGSPRALGALLYGDSEGIPGIRNLPNVIMSTAHARQFSLNAPVAYHLLPSATYLSVKQPNPIMRFGSGSLLEKERNAYGESIDTSPELRSFTLSEEHDRSMPNSDDLMSANILNAGLLSYATNEHAALDAWQAPVGIEVYQLGGYDVPTISGIDLYEAPHQNTAPTIAYRPLFMQDGDGTVPVISALLMNVSMHVHQIWLDLPGMRSGKMWYSHSNMLEAPDVQETIKDLLQGKKIFPPHAHAMDEAPKPIPYAQYAFYIHSPVSISVTDSDGNKSSVREDDSDDDIPGSASGTFGDVKYVLVPVDGAPYTIDLQGEGYGSFTIDMQLLEGNVMIASSTIADVPVTNKTHAKLSIGVSFDSISSLAVDEDGDGTLEFSITPVLGTTVFPDTSEKKSDHILGVIKERLHSITTPIARSTLKVFHGTSTTLTVSTSSAVLTNTKDVTAPPKRVVRMAAVSTIQKMPYASSTTLQSKSSSWVERARQYVQSAVRSLLEFLKTVFRREA